MNLKICVPLVAATLAFVFGPAESRAAGASLNGSVSSAETRNNLEGVLVEIPALNRQTFTDSNGRFILSDLPAGMHEVRVSYLGLESRVERVDVLASGTRALAIALKSGEVVQLQRFVVASEREGNALAVTSQRNATNLKNAVALDALGNMPNTNPGELAMRLPGVTASFDSEGNVSGIQIRGTAAGLNLLSIDGSQVSSGGTFDRAYRMHHLSGAMFEQIEIVKGHTPDQSADSIGGTINLKTRSALSLNERRRVNYSLGARWAPPFFDAAEIRRRHPIHPQLSFSYQEVFDVRGGERNLGFSLSGFYNENVNTHDQILYDYQNTTAQPAFLWDYRESTRYSNRRQDAYHLKVEYRPSQATKVFVNGMYHDGTERHNRIFNTRAFTNQVVATLDASGQPTGTGGILPGFTSTRTEVRGVAASMFELNTSLVSFYNRTRLIGAGAEHKWNAWEIDYDANFSRTHNNVAHGLAGPGGALVMRAAGVGWRLDTSDPSRPVFVQTAGPNLLDVASYRTAVQQTLRDNPGDQDVFNAKGNVLYRVPGARDLRLKAGVFYRRQEVEGRNATRRFDYIGTAPLPAGTSDPMAVQDRGLPLPFVDPATTFPDLSNASLWREDLYFRAVQPFSGYRTATEEITAGYVQARMRIERLTALGGVRVERTDTSGRAFLQTRPATPAEIPDPESRAHADWNHPISNAGGYTRAFPSLHLTYDLTRELKARASWSTSFGRPAFTDIVPTVTENAASQILTISNPSIGPQYSRNLDLALEYYFSATGLVSAGYFRKRISDYILTADSGVVGAGPDNGYLGQYAGYTLRTTRNAGDGEITGWEFDYRQQFSFLPGLFKGLGASANYTVLETEGNFGGATVLSTGQIAGFIPRTGNIGLSYTYRGFGARLLVNYSSGYLAAANVQPARQNFRFPRTLVNAGISYQLRPAIKLFCDFANLTSEPQRLYRYSKANNSNYTRNTPAITFGVSGQF